MSTTAVPGMTRGADGKIESTPANMAVGFRLTAASLRSGSRAEAIEANENAYILATIGVSRGWISIEDARESVLTAQGDEQVLGSKEAYARHIERLADMLVNTPDKAVPMIAAQRLFADPQPHRFAKEIM